MKNPGSQYFMRFHALLIRLYPSDFRSQFGEEMQAVLQDATEEATKQGNRALVVVYLRELCDLPRTMIGLYGSGNRRVNMETHLDENRKLHDRNLEHVSSTRSGRSSWPEALMGILPFLIFSSLVAMGDFAFIGIFLAYSLFILIVIGLAWAKDFPRWSFSYLGYGPLLSLLLMSFRVSPSMLVGFWALIPLCVAALVGVLIPRLRDSLAHLFESVWMDWTLLSFIIYSLLPIPIWMLFDEVDTHFKSPILVLITLILATGALFYLRNANVLLRLATLAITAVLAGFIQTVSLAIYEPAYWYEILLWGFIGVMLLLGVLFAPALLGLLHWIIARPDKFSNA